MRKLFLPAFMVLLVHCASAQTPFYVTTVPPLNGGNGQSGVSFNVKAFQDIILTEFWVSITSTGAASVSVWYNTDSIKGAPTISTTNGWVQLASNVSLTATSAGDGTITRIPHSFSFPMPAGATYGFFVQAHSNSFRYSNGGGSVPAVFSDGTLQINTGNNVGYGGGAPNPGFHIRQFNGRIGYILSKKGHNNAAVGEITNPVYPFCTGNYNLQAVVKNNGFNQINNLKVYWTLNGILQPVINHNNTIDTVGSVAGNKATISLGSVNFSGDPHKIKIYTSMPNGLADTVNADDTLTTELGPSPYAAITPGGQTVFCTAGNINVTLYAPTGTGLNYQWYRDNQPIAGATDTSYTATKAGDYTVKVDSNGCDNTSSVVRVDNLAMPLPLVTPSGNPVLCTGDSIVLQANAGITGAAYQWQFQGNDIPGATTASYIANQPGNYTVVTSKYTCNASSPGVDLVPMSKPEPKIETLPNGTLITQATYVSYQWKLDGNDIPGATGFACIPRKPGSYTVVVSNGGCVGESQPEVVTTVSVNNINAATAISIYPNPARDVLFIDAPVPVKASVLGMDGSLLIETALTRGQPLDISSLQNGVYMIKLADGHGHLLKLHKITRVN